MQKEVNRELIGRINADIYTILDLSAKVGWVGIRPLSLYRILYLTSVLYSFKYPKKQNPFSEDYNFSISLRGPYYEEIEKSLNYLVVNQVIIKDEENDLYRKGNVELGNFDQIPGFSEKREWLTTIIYILGIYGEDKIYDFIFRDPEYKKNLQKNSKTPININSNNETIAVLNAFKTAFEERLGENVIGLDTHKYLKLYFEYVFSVILKGEAEL